MKRQDINSYDGQNWAWPEKTWFRERLNAVKAQEHAKRRRPAAGLQKPPTIEVKPTTEQPVEEN